MSRFPQQCAASDPLLAKTYSEMRELLQRPEPTNFFTALSIRPDLAEAMWDLVKLLFTNGQLPRSLTELIVVVISKISDSHYCAVSHEKALGDVGVAPEVIDQCLVDPNSAAIPESHRGAVAFAIKAAEDPNSITDGDVQGLRILGMNDEEIVEVAVLIALTKMMNTWADASAISADAVIDLASGKTTCRESHQKIT